MGLMSAPFPSGDSFPFQFRRVPGECDRPNRILVEIRQSNFPEPVFAWLSQWVMEEIFGEEGVRMLKATPRITSTVAQICLVKLPQHICRECTSDTALELFGVRHADNSEETLSGTSENDI